MTRVLLGAFLALALAILGCNGDSGTDADAGPGATDTGTPCVTAGADCTAAPCCSGLTCNTATKRCETSTAGGGKLGDPCADDSACKDGLCYSDSRRIPNPYCSIGCTADGECVFPGGETACCNNGVCEVVKAAQCGTRAGTLGDPCASAGTSDCAQGYVCVGGRGPDGLFMDDAICSKGCADDSECHNVCLPATNTCSLSGTQCASDDDCKDKTTECLRCFSGSYPEKICQPDPNCHVKCMKDSDCTDPDEQCGLAVVTNAAGDLTGLEWQCVKSCLASGNKRYGEACTSDDECCSLFCMKGECVGACATAGDCGADHVCTQLTVGLSETDQCLQAQIDMCVALKGSKTPCLGNSDCTVAGEYCQYAPDENGNPATFCGEAAEDALSGGEDCGALGKDCKGGFCSTIGCLDWCDAVEPNDADCQSPAGKMTCTFQQMTDTTGMGICMLANGSQTPCAKDADCPAGEACKTFPVPGGANNLCVTATANGNAVGKECSSTVRCANDLCLSNGICSGICATNADCPANEPGMNWYCVNIGLGCDSATQACIPMPGSGTTCVKDADCGEGEVCKLIPAGDAYALICSTESKEGDKPGAPPGSTCCGDACNPECHECANDMCYFALLDDYVCSAACEVDADCPVQAGVAWTCQDIGGGTKLCVPTAGSGSACKKDADCLNGEVCQVTICGTPYANGDDPGSPIGGPCGSCTNPCDQECVAISCYNGMCTRAGTCTGACEVNADCGTMTYACYHFTDDAGGDIGQCMAALDVLTLSCTTDADCANPAENFCVNPGNDALHCGVKCDTAVQDSCPLGYECKEIKNPDDSSKGFNCVLKI
jgi:hypothetical protein